MVCGTIIFVALLVISPGAYAHVGDRLFSIFELTDEDLVHINLHDGSADDWREVLGEPSLTASEFFIAGVPAYDPADLDFQIWLGWHQATSRIYVAMECSDNTYINQYEGRTGSTHMSLHDSMQFAIDGDHSGGEYDFVPNDFPTLDEFLQVTQAQAQNYFALARTPDTHYVNLGYGFDDWYTQPPYVDGGGGIFGEAPVISVIEFYVTPFDGLVKDGPEQTVISTLSPGKIIGFFLGVIDYDRAPKEFHAGYSVYPPLDTFFTADFFADGVLVGAGGTAPQVSIVENDSWGRIKASLGGR
jgi:hypothetical protein